MSFQRVGKKPSVGIKKNMKKQPVWDDTVTDLTVHKMSPDEQMRRTQVHRSSNLAAVKKERAEKSIRKARANSLDDSKSAFIREILYDETQLGDVLAHTDRVMSVVKDLFADDPRRREAFPNVTLAPQVSNIQERLQGPVYVRPHSESQLTTLSESIMDQYALNEVTSSSQDSTFEQMSSDEEKENVPLNFPQSVVDMDRFQRFISSQQKNASQSNIQILPERGPRNKILSESGNIRMKNGGMQTPEPGDVSMEVPGEMSHLAINDTTKVKKKSKRRMEQEVEEQKAAESNKCDIRTVMQGLQQDISTYEKQSGRCTTPTTSDDSSGIGYTATLLNTIRRLVSYLSQSDLHLKEEHNHRIKLQEQLQHQQALMDALTAEVMSIKELLQSLDTTPGTNQHLHPPRRSLPNNNEHVLGQQTLPPHKMDNAAMAKRTKGGMQDLHQQNSLLQDDKKAKADKLTSLAGYVGGVGDEMELSMNGQRKAVPRFSQPDGLTSSEWFQNIPSLPGKSLRDLSFVGSLNHVQPSSTALMLSPPRQKDRSMLSKPQGMRQLQWNIPDKDVVKFEQPRPADDPSYARQGTQPTNTSGNTKLPSYGITTDGSSRNNKPSTIGDSMTNPSSAHDHNPPAPQHIIYDHGVFPILQTSLAPLPDAQLDINSKMQALKQQHAQARLRLAQLQIGLPGFQGKATDIQERLVLSPAVSPIPFEVETQQPVPEVHHGQKITVSLPKVEELEISATSTPSPKSNLSQLIKRQSTSGDQYSQFSSKQKTRTIIHQGSTPLAASNKKGTEEGFFALTAHVDR